MLEKFFDSSAGGQARVRSLRNGQHGELLDSFSRELFHSRYANITARKHIRSAEHFIHLAISNAIPLLEWNEQALERFVQHVSSLENIYGTGRGEFRRILCGVNRAKMRRRQSLRQRDSA